VFDGVYQNVYFISIYSEQRIAKKMNILHEPASQPGTFFHVYALHSTHGRT
jgi:hypothetical protein